MSTKAERARYEAERSKPGKPKQPPKRRRDIDVDTSLPGVSATNRKVGAGFSAARNQKKGGSSRSTVLLENAKGKPSRKSTRKSANRAKPSSNLTRRQIRRASAPKTRATKAATKAKR